MERQTKIYSPASDGFLKERGRSTAGASSPRPVVIGHRVEHWHRLLTSWPSTAPPQCVVHHWLCAYTDIYVSLSVFTGSLSSLSPCIQKRSPLYSDWLVCLFRTDCLLVCEWSQTRTRPGPWGNFWSGSFQSPPGHWLESQGQKCPGDEPPTGLVWLQTDSAALQNTPGFCRGAHTGTWK